MLHKLKIKFVAISMSLVSIILIVIFSSIYFFVYTIADKDTTNDLNASLKEMAKYEESTRENNMLNIRVKSFDDTYLYDITTDKSIFVNSNTGNEFTDNNNDIDKIAKTVKRRHKSKGFIEEYNIKYTVYSKGNYSYLGIIKVPMLIGMLCSLQSMLISVFLITFIIMLFLTWYLSSLALEPVEKAWKLQKQFIADASHELKTPLTVILANLKILKRYNNLTDEENKWVDNTHDEAIRMKGLIEEMLYLAKGDVEETHLQFADVNFSELVEEVLLTFESIAFEKGLEIVYSGIDDDIHLIGSKPHLKRLIIILVDNACKYSKTGNNVTVSLNKKDKKVIFKITSIGEVIQTENGNKIFERFVRESESRARNTVQNSEGGFGLGLAIAKKITESHKGKIKWEPYEDKGNTFIVELEA